MNIVTLEQVQRATSRCLEAHPVVDNALPRESAPLANLLGLMFFRRIDHIGVGELSTDTVAALTRWSADLKESDVSDV